MQVESVEVSCLGRCGEFHTYSQFPDMDTDVWTTIKVGRVKNNSQLTFGISNLISLPFENSVDEEHSRLKKLKLTMIDTVSLTRNIRTFGKIQICIR